MPRIADYAFLGDLHTGILVHRQGSIDWCCFPRFDSAACFAGLLGTPENGHWLVAPVDPASHSIRRYRPDTLILETLHETPDGVVRVTDFMPPRGHTPDMVRIVEGLRGVVRMRSELVVRFDYGRIVPWVREVDDAWVAIAGPDALCLRAPVETHGENLTTVSEFPVSAGERVPFVLTWFPSYEALPLAIEYQKALEETESFWLDWTGRTVIGGRYAETIRQSLLVLKAMTFVPSGGIVAAPTTSLPEWFHGVRNWDYRFCWLRDASLTLVAMLRAGYGDEATAWSDWLLRAIAGNPADIQIMYGVAGERRLEERTIDWLPGFVDSPPVRVGNDASGQLQLDVYGEVMDAVYQSLVHGGDGSEFSWTLLKHLLQWLEDGWRLPDAGIWEVRGPNRHFTHSKVMAWVAFDRAVRLHEEFGLDGPVTRWRAVRDAIRQDVLTHAWSEQQQAFAQSYGSEVLDASVLLLPIMGFLPPDDARIVSTVAAIQRDLTIDGLVLRYRADGTQGDGLPPGEGVFLACSFWLVEVLALQDRDEEARALFERLLDLRNDLGLLAEEYDPRRGELLGNFPQAFSHLALVTAALTLQTKETR
jgi:GH15 family glucan-1,4-alpha-glucosidase